MTPSEIQAKLEENPRWIEWAVLELYKKQTPTEQEAETTAHDNGVGFNAVDAPLLTSFAKQVQRSPKPHGYRLSEKQQAYARKKLKKYAKQLAQLPDPRTVMVTVPRP